MDLIRKLAPALLLLGLAFLPSCGGDESYDADSIGVRRYGAPVDDDDGDTGPAIAIGKADDTTKKPPRNDGPSAGNGGAAKPPVVKTPKPGKYTEVEVTDGGAIRGAVTFTKAPEQRWTVDFNKDQKSCGHDRQPTQRVIFDPTSLGVANCVVYLADISKGKKWDGEFAKGPDDRTVLLDQKGCTYVPHVLAMRTNTQIVIRNSDPAEHNVHIYKGSASGPTQANVLSPAGSEASLGPAYIEKPSVYEIKCDIHGWMNGYAVALAHPYYVVTGTDGKFELTNVPPGEYTLVMWHEGMGETAQFGVGGITGYDYGDPVEQSQKVTVTGGGAVSADFQMEPPPVPKVR